MFSSAREKASSASVATGWEIDLDRPDVLPDRPRILDRKVFADDLPPEAVCDLGQEDLGCDQGDTTVTRARQQSSRKIRGLLWQEPLERHIRIEHVAHVSAVVLAKLSDRGDGVVETVLPTQTLTALVDPA